MRLGLLSDTHGDSQIALRAVEILQNHGAEFLIHCGDIGSPEVLDAMAGMPGAFVFGNNDYDRKELAEHGAALELACLDDYGKLTLAGKRIAVTHGDEPQSIERAMNPDSRIDYLFTGHTHQRRDVRLQSTRWINPGALYRASIKTVAILDLSDDTLTSIVVAQSHR